MRRIDRPDFFCTLILVVYRFCTRTGVIIVMYHSTGGACDYFLTFPGAAVSLKRGPTLCTPPFRCGFRAGCVGAEVVQCQLFTRSL